MEPIIGYTVEELGAALTVMEADLKKGECVAVQLCTSTIPTDEDLELAGINMVLAGFHASAPQVQIIDGIPTTSFVLRKGSPEWALLIPIIVPILTIGLITFGIFKIETITKALIPILLIAGGIVIVTAGLLARPAERITRRVLEKKAGVPEQAYVASTVPKGASSPNPYEQLDMLPQTELRDEAKELWRKACEWEGVPPESRFVVFSDDNPHLKPYNEAMRKLLRFVQFQKGEWQPEVGREERLVGRPFDEFQAASGGKFLISQVNPHQVKVSRSDRKGEFFIDIGYGGLLPEGTRPAQPASIEEALTSTLHLTKEEVKRVEAGIPEEIDDTDPRAGVLWEMWEDLEAESSPQTVPVSAIPEPYSYHYRRQLRKIPTDKLLEAYNKLKAGQPTGMAVVERDRAWALSAIREVLWERGKLPAGEETTITYVCMYCGKVMGEKPGHGVAGQSSSICRECWAIQMPGEPYPEDEMMPQTIERVKKALGVRSYKWQLLFPKSGEVAEREKHFGNPENALYNALNYLEHGITHKYRDKGDLARLTIWDSQTGEKVPKIGTLDLTQQWTIGYLLGPRLGYEVYQTKTKLPREWTFVEEEPEPILEVTPGMLPPTQTVEREKGWKDFYKGNRVQAVIDSTNWRIEHRNVTEEAQKRLHESLKTDWKDLVEYQNLQAFGFASGLLNKEEAEQLYRIYGGESPSPEKWDKLTLAEKVAGTRFADELLQQRLRHGATSFQTSSKEPFIKVGERVRFIGKSRGRYETWPEGAWLEYGVTGAVKEYHPEQPAVRVRGEYFESLPPYAVVRWDFGGETVIDPVDEGVRWERIGQEAKKLPPDSPEGKRLLDPKLFPKRTEALNRMGDYTILEVHDDGDLTVQSYGKQYVVTIEGAVFEKMYQAATEPGTRTLPFSDITGDIITWRGSFPGLTLTVKVKGAVTTPKTVLETALRPSKAVVRNIVTDKELPFASAWRDKVSWLSSIQFPSGRGMDVKTVEVIVYDIQDLSQVELEDIFRNSLATISEKSESRPAVIPTKPTTEQRQDGELEYIADSPEYLAQTIDMTGWRQKIDEAFQTAISRVKGS